MRFGNGAPKAVLIIADGGTPITYREWDVNPNVKGQDRGGERLVTGSDGSACFTEDHYKTMLKLRGPSDGR